MFVYKVTNGVTAVYKKRLKSKHLKISKDVNLEARKRDEERAIEKEATEANILKLGIGTTSGIPKSQPTIKSFVENANCYDPDGAI